MIVLDASAVLALVFGEPGGERVADLLDQSFLSTVNLAEVLSKCVDRNVSPAVVTRELHNAPIRLVPFDTTQASYVAALRRTVPTNLSLGDRACLALALQHKPATVMTADRAWTAVQLDGVDIELLR